MICEAVRESISEYMDGMLCDAVKEEFEAHLKSCRECRQELRDIQEAVSWVRQAGEPIPPVTLRPAVLEQLAKDKTRWKGRFTPGFSQAAAAAVIFLLLAVGNVSMSGVAMPWDMRSFTARSGPGTEDTVSQLNIEVEAPPEMADPKDDGAKAATDYIEGNRDGEATAVAAAPSVRRFTQNMGRLLLNLLLVPVFIVLSVLAYKKKKEAML
jgi:hypothetical protein